MCHKRIALKVSLPRTGNSVLTILAIKVKFDIIIIYVDFNFSNFLSLNC